MLLDQEMFALLLWLAVSAFFVIGTPINGASIQETVSVSSEGTLAKRWLFLDPYIQGHVTARLWWGRYGYFGSGWRFPAGWHGYRKGVIVRINTYGRYRGYKRSDDPTGDDTDEAVFEIPRPDLLSVPETVTEATRVVVYATSTRADSTASIPFTLTLQPKETADAMLRKHISQYVKIHPEASDDARAATADLDAPTPTPAPVVTETNVKTLYVTMTAS